MPLFLRAGSAIMCAALLASCTAPSLNKARHSYYAGRFAEGEEVLVTGKVHENDHGLMLMERGMLRQAEGEYEESSQDFIAAHNYLEKLETYSVSKGGASLVINDGVQPFCGAPYERTLLHCFTANNHLAVANWDNAAVEARRIILSLQPEKRGDYPEDAYSRYIAGFCLEMIDDPSNAALQYHHANRVLRDVEINEITGYLRPKVPFDTNALNSARPPDSPAAKKGPATPPPWPPDRYENELVCFISLGRSPGAYLRWDDNWKPDAPRYAEIYHDGTLLGRSYNLGDTADLAFETAEQQATLKAAKTVARVAIKEGIALAVESGTNEAVGDLTRLLLIGILEHPDIRRWETLPRWLQVARVPCPPGIEEYDVIVKTAKGRTVRTFHVDNPITRRRNIHVSFCRDLPGQPAVARKP